MKIAVTFLLVSMMVLVTQQQRFPQFGNVLPPWAQRQQPTLQDLYDFLYARSLVQSMNPPMAPHISSNMRVKMNNLSKKYYLK